MANSKDDAFFKEMEKIIRREFPKLLKRKERAFKEKQKVLKRFAPLSLQLLNESKVAELRSANPPSHPWRLCPLGHSWVRAHPRQVKTTKKNPNGYTMVDGHCRINRNKKEIIYFDELERISDQHFDQLEDLPCPIDLGFKRKTASGSKYDSLIAGWTKYWNEVLLPDEPLDPNLVKALMASESGFNEKSKVRQAGRKSNWARGLLQVTDETLKILADEKGELKNHFVNIPQNRALDPSANICAGIRWLFHKKKLASSKLKREVSWREAVGNYKSYLSRMVKNPDEVIQGMKNFDTYYDLLSTCKT